MPKLTIEKVEGIRDGVKLWKLTLPWDHEENLVSYGESLSRALGILARQVQVQERQEQIKQEDGRWKL